MNNINVCFLGDDSNSKNVVGNLLHKYDKNISSSIKDNNYYKIIEKLENDRPEISDKSSLVWSFIIKNKQFNISFINKYNSIDKLFFNKISSSDIGFIIFDVNDYKEKVNVNLKHKLLLTNILGVKNIVVFIDNIGDKNREEIESKLFNMLRKRNFKEKKIFFSYLENGNINNHDEFVDIISKIKLINKSKSKLLIPISNVFRVNKNYLALNGRLLSGTIKTNDFILLNPDISTYKVLELQKEHETIDKASTGDNIGIKIDYNPDIREGMVITNIDNVLIKSNNLICQLIIIDKNEINKGIDCNFYYNFTKVKCSIKDFYRTIDKDNNIIEKKPNTLKNSDNAVVNIVLRNEISILPYKTNNKLGSFVLMSNDEKESILGIGLVKTVRH